MISIGFGELCILQEQTWKHAKVGPKEEKKHKRNIHSSFWPTQTKKKERKAHLPKEVGLKTHRDVA